MTSSQPALRLVLRCIVGALLLAFFTVYGVQCVKHGSWIPADPNRVQTKSDYNKSGDDFTAFYSAGEQARLGNNIYEWKTTSTPRRPYGYPPMFAVFPMMPLSHLSHNAALAVFYVLNMAMLAAAFFMLGKLLWPPASSFPEGTSLWLLPGFGLFAALVLNWRYIHSNTIVGNANMAILFLLTLALHWELTSPRKQAASESAHGGVVSGLAVALAAAIKVTPALFGVFFLWTWRRWAMLGGALGLALFFLFLPAAWLGWDANLKYVRAFAKTMGDKALADGDNDDDDPGEIVIGRPRKLDPNESSNPQGVGVSIRGALTNLLTPAPALKKSGDKPRTVNLVSLEPERMRTISNLCSLILLGITVALTFGARSKRGTHATALAWGLVAVTMVLVSPLSRVAHLVVLAIPIASLVALLQQNLLNGAARKLAWAGLVLLAASGLAPDGRLKAMGLTTFALLFFYFTLAVAFRQMLKQNLAAKIETRLP